MFNGELYVGKVGKSVGLKGESKFFPDTDFLEQFTSGTRFETKKGSLIVEYYHPDRGIIKFENINTPEAAKKITNSELYTTLQATKEQCQLQEGEFYWFDIIGCDVYEDSLLLGKVASIERLEPTDYMLIQTDLALQSQGFNKTFLIPYIDRYVLTTDINAKHVTVQGGMDLLEAS